MSGRGLKPIMALALAMGVVLIAGVLAATDAIDLPGDWGETLGFTDESGTPPCRHGLYRHSPKSPPAPAGRWHFTAPSPTAQVEGSAAAIGPIVYATNGERPYNLQTIVAYDTRSGRWSRPTRAPVGLNHTQVATYHGDLYFAGGYLEGYEATNRFWQYDPRTDRWRELDPMRRARGGAAAAVIGDKLYVAGGARQTFGVSVSGYPYGTLEIYDFKTGRWEAGPDMPVPRHHTVGTALDGRFYVVGGRAGPLAGDNDAPPTDEFDRYDPQAERWERLPPIPLGSSYPGITTAKGRVVVVGGENQTHWEDGGGWVTPTAWAFEPNTNRWERLPDLTIERRGFGAATAAGRIYALMGSYCQGLGPHGPVGTHTVEWLPVTAVGRN